MSVSEVLTAIRANMPFIRGVTVSGGECTLQRDFCLALARSTRELGLNFLLDSNGSYDFSSDPELTDAIDGVMLDVKARDRALHNALTGRDNDTVLKNLSFLADIGKLEEVRAVIVPGINDPEAVIDHVCGVLVSSRPDTRFKIIRYRPMGVREPYRSSFLSPDDALMNSLVERAHVLGIRNTIVL